MASKFTYSRRLLGRIGLYWPAATALTAGLIMSVAALGLTEKWEREIRFAEFEHDAAVALAALRSSVKEMGERVDFLAERFQTLPTLTQEQFHRLTAPMLARRGTIQALQWVPRIPGGLNAAGENTGGGMGTGAGEKSGGRQPGVEIREHDASSRLVPGKTRPEYFPVMYLEPLKGNEDLLGFDLGSTPARRNLLERARDSGRPAASGRIPLAGQGSEAYGILFFQPIFGGGEIPATVEDRRNRLMGYIGALLGISALATDALAFQEAGGLNLQLAIFDRSAPPAEQYLFGEDSPVREMGEQAWYPLSTVGSIPVADRIWQVVAFPPGGANSPVLTGKSVAVFGIGLALTLIFSGILTFHFGRRFQVKKEVARITTNPSESSRHGPSG